jgi:uncharacterized protein (TIGR03435 family)
VLYYDYPTTNYPTNQVTDVRFRFAVVALALISGTAGIAQDAPSPALRFEAASIRPTAPGGPPISGTTIGANRLRAGNATLLNLIRSVFSGEGLISDGEFVGGPDWIRTERWDINAVAAITPTRAQFNEMLRNLLVERFKVRTRREQRELPVFALLVARDDRRLGPKLTNVTVDCAAYKEAFNRLQSRPRPEPGAPLEAATCDTLLVSRPEGTRLAGRAVEMSVLARMLTPYFDSPVLDRTGLSGQYDYDVNFVRDALAAPPADGVPLATALREQLGLRVERQRAPLDVLVIESAERPTPD